MSAISGSTMTDLEKERLGLAREEFEHAKKLDAEKAFFDREKYYSDNRWVRRIAPIAVPALASLLATALLYVQARYNHTSSIRNAENLAARNLYSASTIASAARKQAREAKLADFLMAHKDQIFKKDPETRQQLCAVLLSAFSELDTGKLLLELGRGDGITGGYCDGITISFAWVPFGVGDCGGEDVSSANQHGGSATPNPAL